MTSLYDVARGVELVAAPGGVPRVIDDPSDTWSHDVARFDRAIGAFEAKGQVAVIERGPVFQTVRAHCVWGRSTVTLEYCLYAGDPQVYLTVSVDWHEQLKMLKLVFPFAIAEAQSTSSIPYGRIQRADDGGEEPCQGWVDVSGTVDGQPYGVALLNDCKYGYDVQDGELRMSLLRSPVYAFHMPRQIEPGVTYHYVDQGEQTIHLALVPHAGSYVGGDVVRRAASLNAPPVVAEVDAHPGAWAPAASLVACDAPNIVLTALKLAEEGEDLILRGYETAGQETTAQIRLGANGPCWKVVWRAHEIVTLRVSGGAQAPVRVNILEERVS
jgi:alpha-mannosidase